MSDLTEIFGGTPGQPYGNSTGMIIGKQPDQQGINVIHLSQ